MEEQLSFFGPEKIVISASRRTDIPAFYWDWFKSCIEQGYAETVNPYNGRTSRVDLLPDKVHTIVLWSKNYANFIKDHAFLKEYNLYFQFTINGYSKVLEPNVPPMSETIEQARRIAEEYGPKAINIRFDPILLTTDCAGELINTCPKYGRARLIAFEKLCMELQRIGIKRVTTSFVSLYGHVRKRLEKHGIKYKELSAEEQIEFIKRMVEIADRYGVQIYTCSSPLIENVPGVKKSSCIDGKLLMELYGGNVSTKKDKGQRKACGCTESRDIGGAYISGTNKLQAKTCRHNCLYCYGNAES